MSKGISIDGITPLSDTLPTPKSSSSCSVSSNLDDINYLLYLETLKRFKEDEQNIKNQVDEKSRQYEEVKAENRYYYELYVQLYQAAVTRGILEEERSLKKDQIKQSHSDVKSIMEKISNDKTIAYFNPETLEKFKEAVRSICNHDEMHQIQEEISKQKEAVKVIQNLNEAIQLKLESSIVQSLDYFVELNTAKHLEKENNPDNNPNDRTPF